MIALQRTVSAHGGNSVTAEVVMPVDNFEGLCGIVRAHPLSRREARYVANLVREVAGKAAPRSFWAALWARISCDD